MMSAQGYREDTEEVLNSFISSLNEILINIWNALIIADLKLLSKKNGNSFLDFDQLHDISNELIEEISSLTACIKQDLPVRLQSSPKIEATIQLGLQAYDLLLENTKLRKGMNSLFLLTN